MRITIPHKILALAVCIAVTACKQPKAGRQEQEKPRQETNESGSLQQEEAMPTDFTMDGIDGKPVSAAKEFAKNKITVIDFWASWCGPCRQEMPSLVKTYNAYKDKGLGIIGVSLDEDRNQWESAVREMGMTWTQVSDLQGWDNSAARKFEVQAIPFTVVVDNKGEILGSGLRGGDLEAFIADRLRQPGMTER